MAKMYHRNRLFIAGNGGYCFKVIDDHVIIFDREAGGFFECLAQMTGFNCFGEIQFAMATVLKAKPPTSEFYRQVCRQGTIASTKKNIDLTIAVQVRHQFHGSADMAVAGCLFVIPTAAEIPIVQTMMLAGMGTAPALALLITLPAISLPSLVMLRKSFPAKALWLTAGLVALSGVMVGSIALV